MSREIEKTERFATAILSSTLVGSHGEFPRRHGNCFSVKLRRWPKPVRIINFLTENLNHLISEKIVTWPIRVVQFNASHIAIIDDPRIPAEYYHPQYCSICTPERFQTKEWRDDLAKRIKSGVVKRSIFRLPDGKKAYMDRVEFKARPQPLNFKYTLGAEIILGGMSDKELQANLEAQLKSDGLVK